MNPFRNYANLNYRETFKVNSPHGLYGNWLEDVLSAADTYAEATLELEGRRNVEWGQFLDRKHIKVSMTHPSPSSLIAVSARTRRTKPTVVFSLQSIPNRHDSSISFDELLLQLLPTFDSVSHWLSSMLVGLCAVLSSANASLSHVVFLLVLKREPPLFDASLK